MNRGHKILVSTVMLLCLTGFITISGHAQQPLLQITSPTSGSVVTEGTTITITVSADPSVQNIFVLSNNPLPDAQAGSSTTQFTLAIPKGIPAGWYSLTAIGGTSSGEVISAPIKIDVEWPYYPFAIKASPPLVVLRAIGDQFPIRVAGTFVNRDANGNSLGTQDLDITQSPRTTYSSKNTHVATVSSTGMVTAVSTGQTIVMAQNGIFTGQTVPVSTAIIVQVLPQAANGTPR